MFHLTIITLKLENEETMKVAEISYLLSIRDDPVMMRLSRTLEQDEDNEYNDEDDAVDTNFPPVADRLLRPCFEVQLTEVLLVAVDEKQCLAKLILSPPCSDPDPGVLIFSSLNNLYKFKDSLLSCRKSLQIIEINLRQKITEYMQTK